MNKCLLKVGEFYKVSKHHDHHQCQVGKLIQVDYSFGRPIAVLDFNGNNIYGTSIFVDALEPVENQLQESQTFWFVSDDDNLYSGEKYKTEQLATQKATELTKQYKKLFYVLKVVCSFTLSEQPVVRKNYN